VSASLPYRLLRRLPFKEIWLPLKMMKGAWRNRSFVFPQFTPATCGAGRLEQVNGAWLMHLSGDPYDIGKQHGTLLKPQIGALTERYLGIFAGQYEHDLELARRMEQHIPERFREELRGLGDASGIGYDHALVTACFLDLHKVAACSTFVVHGPSSRTGEIMFGRNLDFPSMNVAHHASLIACVKPTGALKPTINITWPGFIGVLSGMNSDGLSLAMMIIYGQTRHDHLKGVPFALHYRQVLEECANVAEATERFSRREAGVSNNIMLADAGRHAVTVEMRADEVGFVGADKEFPVYRCTNHFRSGRRKWSFAFSAPSSYPRLWALNKAAKTREPYDEASLKRVVQRVAIARMNLQRIVFYPERREVEVAFGVPSGGERTYHYVGADKLWS
jgi:predicted choloylglycine hydrolase